MIVTEGRIAQGPQIAAGPEGGCPDPSGPRRAIRPACRIFSADALHWYSTPVYENKNN